MRAYANGAWRDVARGKVFAGGAWRTITRALVWQAGAWRTAVQFAPPLGVSVPGLVTVNGYEPGSAVLDAYVTATPTGGLAPYTYQWAADAWVELHGQTLASVTATASVDPGGSGYSATLSVTVTDAIGQTATGTAVAHFQNYWGY